jgi:hypothetical protein
MEISKMRFKSRTGRETACCSDSIGRGKAIRVKETLSRRSPGFFHESGTHVERRALMTQRSPPGKPRLPLEISSASGKQWRHHFRKAEVVSEIRCLIASRKSNQKHAVAECDPGECGFFCVISNRQM